MKSLVPRLVTASLIWLGIIATVSATQLSNTDIEDLVRHSYQYVTMYNVNNKFAQKLGGWNTCAADTELKDHTMREIARPNNDTLYISCMLDLRKDPVIVDVPAFDSDYVSLMVTGYDHYVNVPLASRKGDFKQPEKILFYSERTDGYDGKPVQGVDQTFEATGDFISAVFRVMPHSNEAQRFKHIIEQMKSVKAVTLAEYQGKKPKPTEEPNFPAVGETDIAVFGDNLLEVMQFVFNHTTFDADSPMDQAVLSLYKPLGIEPGKKFDPEVIAYIDKKRLRETARKIEKKWLESMSDENFPIEKYQPKMFQPKGKTDLETVLMVSATGPIGLPWEEAAYPAVATPDGKPMNAKHDYVIHMSKDELPPAGAFWSLTLYDLDRGFFIPNDQKKYSVGKNAGMKLNADGGIDIYIAAKKPEGVPEENWLPIKRKDQDLNAIMRIYVPDLEKLKTWSVPQAEKITAN